jgi:cytochrome c oxidase cbb3-type subunit 3
LHGASIEQLRKSVADGVLEKGMPPWAKVLKPEQLDAVVVYVFTLKGTNPPNPKAPQGELVAR